MESTDVEKTRVVPGEKASWSDLEKESVNTDDAQRKLILNQVKNSLQSKITRRTLSQSIISQPKKIQNI